MFIYFLCSYVNPKEHSLFCPLLDFLHIMTTCCCNRVTSARDTFHQCADLAFIDTTVCWGGTRLACCYSNVTNKNFVRTEVFPFAANIYIKNGETFTVEYENTKNFKVWGFLCFALFFLMEQIYELRYSSGDMIVKCKDPLSVWSNQWHMKLKSISVGVL